MQVPESIEVLIAEFDRQMEPLDTHTVQAALSSARTKLAEKIPTGDAWADLVAFALQVAQEEHLPWNTYFGPMGSCKYKDGSVSYSPDPRDITPEIVDHWEQRADVLTNPVLKARYADLVWDLSRKAADRRANIRFAHIAIDSYLASVSDGRNRDFHDDIEALMRALQLSTSIRDNDRTAIAKGMMIERFHAEVGQDGWWIQLYDALVANRKCGLTDADKNGMIAGLEKLFARATTDETLDPHSAERIACRLLPFYSSGDDFDNVKRVGIAVSEAFERIASTGSRMQAMVWLQTAADFARRAGEADRLNRLKVEREEAIRASASEMKSFSFSHEFKKSEVEEYVEAILDETNWQQSLFNIAAHFIVPKQQLRHQAERAAETSPLMAAITMSVIADDHVAAQVDGDDDADGPLYRHADFSRQFNRLHLCKALEGAVKRHSLSPEEIAAFMQRSSLFSDLPLLVAGVKAWFDGDYVKSIFVLVPQVEDAFRNVARNLGESVTKDKRGQSGWEVSMNLGDLLSMGKVRVEVGEDIHFWMRAIFADARGMNLRNQIAHGLVGREAATYYNCEMVIHCMLILGAYKDVAIACARRAEAAEGKRAASVAEETILESEEFVSPEFEEGDDIALVLEREELGKE
ncbi:DUF4209 domain-containing protein [Sinorhizobium meliloti]|uniref:DUF4209 domain-containing protein n=1 Tax=Rhizobium meliloti TaxID=382 RepID=UPI0001E4ACB5|nr:DUF4209 domain-containing protein [Sinorhizobium meliloti]AEG58217.1 hypothetical protein Sinme_6874 [Sinorhizobium meliloti AK83]MDE4589187.1 DUF4209 domain-containing protein [Sinorhizobium meliloti]SEJ85420.1 protein of unknown function [Sinorhizobium meliloti]